MCTGSPGRGRPTPPEDLNRSDGTKKKPGDPDWTGDVGVLSGYVPRFKSETHRGDYYTDAYTPMRGGLAKIKSSPYDEDNPPEWHYNKDAPFYDFLPDDMQRGEGSAWKNEQDAFNRERLRIKNEVRSGSGSAYGRDPGAYGGTSHRSQGVNL